MIKMNENQEVVINYKGIEYCLKKQEEYKDFVILLTDPIKKFDKSYLEINEGLNPEETAICEKYKDFLEQFLNIKDSVIKDAKEQLQKKILEE